MNDKGNMPRCGVIPKFSDLEVIALSLTQETMGYDSECDLFGQLEDYRSKLPHLISRRQYNDRRKFTAALCEEIRKRVAEFLDGGEDVFIIDSKTRQSVPALKRQPQYDGQDLPREGPGLRILRHSSPVLLWLQAACRLRDIGRDPFL